MEVLRHEHSATCVLVNQIDALANAATHVKKLASVFGLLGCDSEAVVGSDVAVGICIASRQGCTQLRHFQAPWLQDDPWE